MAAKVCLIIAAVNLGISSIETLPKIYVNSMLGFSIETNVLQMVFNILAIVAIVFTMMRKRWGLIALLSIAVTGMFLTIPVGGKASYSYHLGSQVGEFLFNYGPFIIAMCFKRDGFSGWVSMLASEKYVKEHIKNDAPAQLSQDENIKTADQAEVGE